MTFFVATRKSPPAGARPGQSPPTEGTPRTEQQDQGPGPRPSPGRRIVSGMPCLNEGTTADRQWRSRAGSIPFCSAEGSRGRRIVASMSEPAGRVSATRQRQVGEAPANRRCGGFWDPSFVATKEVARRGETRQQAPTEGTSKSNSKDQGLDPDFAGATESCPNARNEGATTRRQWRNHLS